MAPPSRTIVSLLPAATEMAFALGLGDQVRAVSHECDYPSGVGSLPRITRPALKLEGLSQAQIDQAVSDRLATGASLYEIDEILLRRLAPDLILTQNLCAVCAPSDLELGPLAAGLDPAPEVLAFSPSSIADIFENLDRLGRSTGTLTAAQAVTARAQQRLEAMSSLLSDGVPRTRAVFLEWVDPVYGAGHWVPEMVQLAGGFDPLGRPGVDSVRTDWEDVLQAAPEVLILSPCGLNLSRALEEGRALFRRPGWDGLPAVRSGRVFAVDANAYFARPGPRVSEGVELLAHLLHPELVDWRGPADAFAPLGHA